jgi:hypothetical protein
VGRRTREVTLQDRGDAKTYFITEMSAEAAEKWAIKAFLGLAKSGVDIPDDIAERGLAGVASIGFKALGGMDFEYLEPLLDEMFACVQFKTTAGIRGLVASDIEDVANRLRLRAEVFELHTGFSIPGARSISAEPGEEQAETSKSPPSSGMRIRLKPLER